MSAIDRWPEGERPTYFATPGAWEILQLLDRPGVRIRESLQLLEPFSTRDIRGAYFLTRDRHELERRAVLVSGHDAGRATRISARNSLRRAFLQAQIMEEAAQFDVAAQTATLEVRAEPPKRLGFRLRLARQVFEIACSAQPLPIRLRFLMEVQPERLMAAAALVRGLAPGQCLYANWPSDHEGKQILRLLGQAIALQEELA